MFSKNDIKNLIINHSRRLQKLKETQALYGIETSSAILIEIEDIETKIEKLQNDLQELTERESVKKTEQSAKPGIYIPLHLTPKLPCLLLLDVSGSMSGEPIYALSKGLKAFVEDLQSNPITLDHIELALITFGNYASILWDFAPAHEFYVPDLVASGSTAMGEAIKFGLDLIERRKQDYHNQGIPYYKPIVLLLTDGTPTDDWLASVNRLHKESGLKKLQFITVGIEGADMEFLNRVSPPGTKPIWLNDLRFSDLFVWLSSSMSLISTEEEFKLLPFPQENTKLLSSIENRQPSNGVAISLKFNEDGLVIEDEQELKASLVEALFAAESQAQVTFYVAFEPLEVVKGYINSIEAGDTSPENRIAKVHFLRQAKSLERKHKAATLALTLFLLPPLQHHFVSVKELIESLHGLARLSFDFQCDESANSLAVAIFRKNDPELNTVIWIDEAEQEEIKTLSGSNNVFATIMACDLFDLPRKTRFGKAIPAIILTTAFEAIRTDQDIHNLFDLSKVLDLYSWSVGLQ